MRISPHTFARIGISGSFDIVFIAAAEDRTEGWHRSMVLATQAGIFLDTNAFGKAITHLRKALDYGNEFYEPKHTDSASSADPQKIPGTHKWKAYRPKIQQALKEAKKQRDIAKYGKGFAYWRIARRAHLNGNYKKAATQYELITRMFPKSIYAQGAGYWRAITHLERGNKEKCVETLQAFIDEQPLGLFRGKALYKIAVIRLHRDWNPQAAYKAFRRTLQWIKKVRNRQQDVELYVVPDKAREVTKPPAAPLEPDRMGCLHRVKVKPRHLICRKTADYYLSWLYTRTQFYRGFFAFISERYDKAEKYWTAGFEANEQLQNRHEHYIGSRYRRLMCAVRGKKLLVDPLEMKQFRDSTRKRLKLMLADFYGILLRWDRAERLYHELLNNERLSREQEAVVYRRVSRMHEHRDNREKANDMLRRIIKEYPDTVAARKARLDYARYRDEPRDQKVDKLLQLYQKFPAETKSRRDALFNAVAACWQIDNDRMAELCRRFIKEYPDTVHTPVVKELLQEYRNGEVQSRTNSSSSDKREN